MKKENNVVVENNNKKIIMGAVGVIVLVLVIIGIVFGIKSCGKKSNDQKLKDNLTAMGKTFYEEFYYPQMEKTQDDIKEYMKKFENTGIKVNLTNLSKISKVDQKLVDSLTKENCDGEKTSVRITPKEPYGKTDYNIEVELSCGKNTDKK